MAASASSMVFAPVRVTTITRSFYFFYFLGKVGRKTKTETVLVEENMDLRKNRKGNLGLSKFWTLSKGQGRKKWGF